MGKEKKIFPFFQRWKDFFLINQNRVIIYFKLKILVKKTFLEEQLHNCKDDLLFIKTIVSLGE